jgi:hypothetical protein
MRELSRFYGIVVWMHAEDDDRAPPGSLVHRSPPNIHVTSERVWRKEGVDRPEWHVRLSIQNGRHMGWGSCRPSPTNAPCIELRLVRDWIALHRDELMNAWERTLADLPHEPIPPLRVY